MNVWSNEKYCDLANLILGAILFLSPWMFGFAAGHESQDAWVTGIRREQSPSRTGARRVEWSERYGVWKIQPLVDWDAKRVDAYIHVNEIPYNPLHDVGYPSIGCMPCTRPVVKDEDERAGRWGDSDKIECGIHER